MNPTYQKDDIITIRTWDGKTRTVEVYGREDDIKNGRPGGDGVVLRSTDSSKIGDQVWWYDDQFICREEEEESK